MLGIGIPILNNIYQTMLNPTTGSWMNWTVSNATMTGNVTAYTPFELSYWRLMTIIITLMLIIFILMLIGGKFRREQQPPM